jgi:hypothetical protein
MLVGLPSGAVSFVLVWIGALIPLYFPNDIRPTAIPRGGALLAANQVLTTMPQLA